MSHDPIRDRAPYRRRPPLSVWVNVDPGIPATFAALLRCAVASTRTVPDAVATVAFRIPALVVIDVNERAANVPAFVRVLRRAAPECQVILRARGDREELGDLRKAGSAWLVSPGPDVYPTMLLARDLLAFGDHVLPRLPGGPPWPALVQYVATHYRHRLTPASLAESVGLPTRSVSDVLRRATGESVLDFIGRVRVEVARQLLEGTDHSLAEVARASGFSDASHLSRVFARVAHARPGHYRQTVRSQGPASPGRGETSAAS